MIGRVVKSTRGARPLMLAAALCAISSGWASAADLGGNCCADLEERIAELEATTARKGNRKVSLTISGWVNEAVFLWDDGSDRDIYVGTNAMEQSRVRFLGEAKITSDWSAGYILEIGANGSPSNQWNQLSPRSTSLNPNNFENTPLIRKSNWFVKSKTYGQLAVGLNGTSTYHLLDDADPTLTRNVNDAEGAAIFMSAFQLKSNGATIGNPASPLKWTDALRGFNNSTPGDSGRRNVIRYDTPTIQGFTASVSWGEDDLWDTSLTYKNDIGDFTVVARIGYGESTDPGTATPVGTSGYVSGGSACISGSSIASSLPRFNCSWEAAGGTIIHKPTGLFVYGGWGRQEISTQGSANATLFDSDSTVWFIQPGIEYKWLSYGKTNIFGEYRKDDAGSNPGRTVGANIHFWQAGIIQNFEAADLSLYAVYQHADGAVFGTGVGANAAPAGKTNLDAFDEVITGAKINF